MEWDNSLGENKKRQTHVNTEFAAFKSMRHRGFEPLNEPGQTRINTGFCHIDNRQVTQEVTQRNTNNLLLSK
jgi:hypothetical protein